MFVALSMLALSFPAMAAPGDSPRPRFGASMSMTEEQEATLLEKIEARDPERAQRLSMLKTRDPAKYYDLLHRVARGLEREANDPEARVRHERVQGLHHEIKALALEWNAAEEGEQKKIRKEMEKLASEVFDLRQEERRSRLTELRERLEEAESEVKEQDANRDEVIAEHLDRLLENVAK